MLDVEKGLSEAVKHFWRVRRKQKKRQGGKSGKKDAGQRGSVTGGKHADGFIKIVAEILKDSGIADAHVYTTKKRSRSLPSFFRPTKEWDVICKSGDNLIAVIEIKSHVGSFGNNFNNRVEEALGNATDFWAAYEKGLFKPSAQPFLGFLLLLEEHPKSVTPQKRDVKLPHYPILEEFQRISYIQRYILFCERLVRRKLYDATCLIMSNRKDGAKGKYTEPSPELEFRNFAAALAAKAAAFSNIKSGSPR